MSISYCHQGSLYVFFFSVRNKNGNFSFQRHGRSQQGARGTWWFQKPFNDAASCRGRGGLSLSFLSPTGSEPTGGHSTAFCHAHTDTYTCTHTHTQTNQLQSKQQEAAECLPLCHRICKHPLQTTAKTSYSLGYSQPENLGILPSRQPLGLALLPEPHRKVINSLNKASEKD